MLFLIFTCSIMLASKFFDDVYYNNAYYARVGGISNLEINSLEMEMLRMISFSLFVQPEQYERQAYPVPKVFPRLKPVYELSNLPFLHRGRDAPRIYPPGRGDQRRIASLIWHESTRGLESLPGFEGVGFAGTGMALSAHEVSSTASNRVLSSLCVLSSQVPDQPVHTREASSPARAAASRDNVPLTPLCCGAIVATFLCTNTSIGR